MKNTVFSVTRSHATTKPRVSCEDLPFYHPHLGSVALGLAGSGPSRLGGEIRTPTAEPAYLDFFSENEEEKESAVSFVALEDLPECVSVDYKFVGSFNNNALKVSWDIRSDEYAIDWVAVKTFTGIQVKYVIPKKHSPLVFAFADEDAFAYCDKDPCIECKFRCKAGMVAYIAVRNLGIVRMPLERMATPIPTSSVGI